jgi:hypothetical protein
LTEQAGGSITPERSDVYGGYTQSGFDNGSFSTAPPSIQFALFEFSRPVDISQVIVDDVSNFGRSNWYAGGSGTPDVSTNLLGLLASLGVQESLDNLTDGIFIFNVSGLTGIAYLLVGTPPRNDDYGPLTATGIEQFYINGFNMAPAVTPIPAAIWLFGSGLLGLIGIERKTQAG